LDDSFTLFPTLALLLPLLFIHLQERQDGLLLLLCRVGHLEEKWRGRSESAREMEANGKKRKRSREEVVKTEKKKLNLFFLHLQNEGASSRF